MCIAAGLTALYQRYLHSSPYLFLSISSYSLVPPVDKTHIARYLGKAQISKLESTSAEPHTKVLPLSSSGFRLRASDPAPMTHHLPLAFDMRPQAPAKRRTVPALCASRFQNPCVGHPSLCALRSVLCALLPIPLTKKSRKTRFRILRDFFILPCTGQARPAPGLLIFRF